jgi:hypothetical protein
MDFNTVASTFQQIAQDGTTLKGQLEKLDPNSAPTSDQQKAANDLLTLAQQGVSQLTQAANDSRQKRIQDLTSQIDAITDALSTGLDSGTSDHLTSMQNNLLAERAQLELINAADFSHVVSPDFVQKLTVQLKAVQQEVVTKQRVAAAIPALLGAVQMAIKIAGFVLAAVA